MVPNEIPAEFIPPEINGQETIEQIKNRDFREVAF